MRAEILCVLAVLLFPCIAFSDTFPPGYNEIQEEGTAVTKRRRFNFIGSGVTAADDSANGRTNVTISTGGNSFETVDVPAGTDPVADSSTDTLLITETTPFAITGTAGTDTIDFTVDAGADFDSSGLIEADSVALTTDTTGDYVKDVADGTGIDGTATGEGSTYTPSLDLTEISSFTLGAGAATGITFDAGATDPTIATTSGAITVTGGSSAVLRASAVLSTLTLSGTDAVFTNSTIDVQNATPTYKWTDSGGDDYEMTLKNGVFSLVNFTDGIPTGLVWRTTQANEFQTIQKLITEGGADLNGAINAFNASSFTLPNSLVWRGVTYSAPPADGTNGQFLTTNGSGSLSWTTSSGSGDITSVGDVASGAAFDGTQGTTLTFNNAGGDATLDYDGTDLSFSKGATFAGDVDIDASNANITLQHTGGAEFGWHVEPNDLTYIRKAGGATLIGLGAANELFLGQVGSKIARLDVHASTAGDGGVNLGPARIGQGEIDWANIRFTRSVYYENLAAADDNKSLGSWDRPVTIRGIRLHHNGTPTTPAVIALEDGAGNAMTHSAPTPTTESAVAPTAQVTAGNQLISGELLRFDVTNSVSPETDDWTIDVDYSYDG